MGCARHAFDAARGIEGAGGGDGFEGRGYREELRIFRESRQKGREVLFRAVFGEAARHAKRQIQAQGGVAALGEQMRRQRGWVAHRARGAGLPMLPSAACNADPALAGIKAPIRMSGDHGAKSLARGLEFVSCCPQDEGRA